MAANMLNKGHQALEHVPEEHLPAVVRWLELLASTTGERDVEPEELWLLATGELKKMSDEADAAMPLWKNGKE